MLLANITTLLGLSHCIAPARIALEFGLGADETGIDLIGFPNQF